jgi:predicted peptidase
MTKPLRFGMPIGVLLCSMLLTTARAEEGIKPGFHNLVFKDADGKEAKYVLFVPHNYKPEEAAPLVLFLHGAGETGEDGEKQAKVGLGPAIKKMEKTFPAFAIFPQSQKRTWGANSSDAKRALGILAEIEMKYKIDTKRIYLTGLSMGGFGTWSLAVAHPDKWAAIVPICGGGNPKAVGPIKDLPCWCFHGKDDNIVSVAKSREMIEALKAAGGNPEYTEYPGVGHTSWDKAYGTEKLYEWLWAQKRK